MTAAEFRSKAPHRTCWLRLEWDDEEPTTLVRDLKASGWTLCDCQPLVRLPGRPNYRDFERPGSGPLRGWTPAERRANLLEARLVLARHGILKVPVRRLALRDLL